MPSQNWFFKNNIRTPVSGQDYVLLGNLESNDAGGPQDTAAARVEDLGNSRLRFVRPYVVGNTYQPEDAVNDQNWVMVANKVTDDRAAPQAVGSPQWVTDILGGIAWDPPQTANSATLFVGSRYQAIPGASFFAGVWAFFRAVRLWIPDGADGATCQLWLILNSTTAPDYRLMIPEFTIDNDDEDRWIEVPQGQISIPPHTIFDVVASFRGTTQASQFTYTWDYERKNGNPDSGKAWHQSNGYDLRFHQNDKDDTNRSSDLDNVSAGSTIQMATTGQNWTVLSASKSGSVYTFIVEPATRASEDESGFTFTYFQARDIAYVRDDNFYASDDEINGFFSTTGYDPGSVTLDQHAYGVDIQLQESTKSEDWDILVGNSSAGSSPDLVASKSLANDSPDYRNVQLYDAQGFELTPFRLIQAIAGGPKSHFDAVQLPLGDNLAGNGWLQIDPSLSGNDRSEVELDPLHNVHAYHILDSDADNNPGVYRNLVQGNIDAMWQFGFWWWVPLRVYEGQVTLFLDVANGVNPGWATPGIGCRIIFTFIKAADGRQMFRIANTVDFWVSKANDNNYHMLTVHFYPQSDFCDFYVDRRFIIHTDWTWQQLSQGNTRLNLQSGSTPGDNRKAFFKGFWQYDDILQ